MKNTNVMQFKVVKNTKSFVKINRGVWGSHLIIDEVFEDIGSELREGRNGTYIRVLNTSNSQYPKKILKVLVQPNDYEMVAERETKIENETKSSLSDAEILDQIRTKFALMEEMAKSCADGIIKGLVVCGAPGTGKSHNIQKVLEASGYENLVVTESDEDIDDYNPFEGVKYYVKCKGKVTPLALYMLLYKHKDAVIVFDDCDSVLADNVSLNILKAALDSYSKRTISWHSKAIADNIPRSFDFTGRIIFISNLYFDKFRPNSQLKMHIDAIMSRTHFMDLGMTTNKEKILRIQQSIEDGLLDHTGMGRKAIKDIVEFLYENQDQFREISLRTALKVSETMKINPDNWRALALLTCTGGRPLEVEA